jgi:hypothetical protein
MTRALATADTVSAIIPIADGRARRASFKVVSNAYLLKHDR